MSIHTIAALKPARLPNPPSAVYIGMAPKTLSNKRSLIEQGKLDESEAPRVHSRAGEKGSRVFYLVADLDIWLDEQASKTAGGR